MAPATIRDVILRLFTLVENHHEVAEVGCNPGCRGRVPARAQPEDPFLGGPSAHLMSLPRGHASKRAEEVGTMREGAEEQSLEALEERMEERWAAEEDDEEAALERLIEALVSPPPVDVPSIPRRLDRNEFICSSCLLVRPRASLVDFVLMTCSECVGASRARAGA